MALLMGVWLLALAWLRPLSDPDEGRYAVAALQMLRSGDWVTPALNGLPFSTSRHCITGWPLRALSLPVCMNGWRVCRRCWAHGWRLCPCWSCSSAMPARRWRWPPPWCW